MVKMIKTLAIIFAFIGFNVHANEINHPIVKKFSISDFMYAGGANSYLYYSSDHGTTWHVTQQRPNDHNAIGGVFAINDTIYISTTSKYLFYSMDNGTTWNSTTFAPDYGKIQCVFVMPDNTIYIGTRKGNIFKSVDTGAHWTALGAVPVPGLSVNSLFVTPTATYVGSADGNVYYSTDQTNWIAINGQLDGSAVKSIYLSNNTLYVLTNNTYVYTSTDLTGGGMWNTFAQSAYSLFVNPNASTILAGTQGGFVFSLITNSEVGFISYTPLNSIFFLG